MKLKENNILLSRVLIYVFACAILALDALCILIGTQESSALRQWLLQAVNEEKIFQLTVCIYLCSAPGFILLHRMHKLLGNLQKGIIFDSQNVILLGTVSSCCYCAGMICLVFVLQGLITLLAITIAAWFVALIVQIVQDVFRKAIAMKDELDFTI